MLDGPWVTDMVQEQGRYGLTMWRVLEERLTFSTVLTLAGVCTTVDMARTFLSAVVMPKVYFC